MTRYAQAKHMAITDPYWAGYIAGLDDKHHVRDNTREAEHAEVNRLLQARLDRIEDAANLAAWTAANSAPKRPKPRPTENAADLGAPRYS